MTTTEVIKEIEIERDYQNHKWGKDHDQKESIGDFMIYMDEYLESAKRRLTRNSKQQALEQIRKVAALAVACMEIHGCPSREITW